MINITELPTKTLELITEHRMLALKSFLDNAYARGETPLIAFQAVIDGETHPSFPSAEDENGMFLLNMSVAAIGDYWIDEPSYTLVVKTAINRKRVSLELPICRIVYLTVKDATDNSLILISTFSPIAHIENQPKVEEKPKPNLKVVR